MIGEFSQDDGYECACCGQDVPMRVMIEKITGWLCMDCAREYEQKLLLSGPTATTYGILVSQ